MGNINRIPYNYDNFCRIQRELEEYKEIVLKLNARITIFEGEREKKTAAKAATKKS